MNKVSVPISNNFCPQTMFMYGTYKEDGTPNFGLFCWFSYCWDGGLSVMACIGGEKLTKDRIRQTGMFSANLVTEALVPLADYCGNTSGYAPEKANVSITVLPGAVLDVPILKDSPLSFELEVTKEIPLDGGDVFICKIRNVLVDEVLTDESKSIEERLHAIAPAATTCQTYFSYSGAAMGRWGEPGKALKK
jgi:flavin reductase (DIM6/NTAB) family NADH-FMN oxidoreductase RutF